MIANTEDQDLLWGFPGITIKAGLVGLPNAGKSLTFNALSQLNVPAENYPFCTIDPNKAILPIGDERLAKLNEIYHPEKQSPANL
jgi:ribosome-binding ATPase YchF (GTP1/OBG family)